MFLQEATCVVAGEGDPKAKICLIGEAPSYEEIRTGRPFVGPAGAILEQCLHKAGLIRADLYITNVFKQIVKKNTKGEIFLGGEKVFSELGGFTKAGEVHREALREELEATQCNVYVPMGKPAMQALMSQMAVTERRGYTCESTLLPGRKVLPTIHPAAALRGKYIWRYYISHDLQKAASLSHTPDLIYPEPETLYEFGYEETLQMLGYFLNQPVVACDIEILQHEVSCLSFSDAPTWGISIPFDDRWTLEQEMEIWKGVARILESPTIVKVGQNFIFDMQFLAFKMGILTKSYYRERCLLHDTMIAHSLVYPDFEKSLRFLASIYTNFPFWKDLIKFKVKDQRKKEA